MFLATWITFAQTLTRDWAQVRRSTRALCAFNDRDLADIGLTRFEDAVGARRDRALG